MFLAVLDCLSEIFQFVAILWLLYQELNRPYV